MNAFEDFNRGVQLSMEQRHADAVAAFESALLTDPGHVGAMAGKGMALAKLGRTNGALEAFIGASLLQPDNGSLHYQAGLCFLQLGQLSQARDCVQLALSREGDDEFRQRCAVELYNIGGYYMTGAAKWRARGALDQEAVGYQLAEVSFELALECSPHLHQAARGLSVMHAARGDSGEAARFASIADRLQSSR